MRVVNGQRVGAQRGVWTWLRQAVADHRWRAALLALAVVPLLLARSPHVPYLDFCSYYTAGLLSAAGEPDSAFDAGRLRARYAELHGGPQGVGPFLYSPLWLAPAAAFTAWPLPAAERLNRGLGAASLGLGLFFLLLRWSRASDQVGVAVAFAVAHPVWVQLIYQNWTFVLFAALATAGWALSRGRSGAAALLWALAIHLKVFLALGLLALWVAGRRRVVVAAAACALLLAAATLPFVGFDSWQRWATNLRRAEASGLTPFYNKVSIAAGVARLSTTPREWIQPRGPVDRAAVRGVFWAALPLLALGLHRLRDDAERALAFTYGWILLAVPQIWDHTEILLFLLLPALRPRYLRLVTGLLALSALYNGALQPMLVAAARGDGSATAVRIFLSLFPTLNLAAAAAVLASHAAHGAPVDLPDEEGVVSAATVSED